MTEPYLILHKVRGEPAFDIAIRLRCAICNGIGGANVPDFETGENNVYEGPSCSECDGFGYWWIIPTSGHRAYPFKEWSLSDLSIDHKFDQEYPCSVMIPEDWPDHYPSNSPPPTRLPLAGLLSKLGFGPKPIKRRSFRD